HLYALLNSCCLHPDEHSFPTRRSSDLFRQALVHKTRQRALPRSAKFRSHEIRSFRRRSKIIVVGCWLFVVGFGMKNNGRDVALLDRKSTRLNSSHVKISYAVFCLKKKN